VVVWLIFGGVETSSIQNGSSSSFILFTIKLHIAISLREEIEYAAFPLS